MSTVLITGASRGLGLEMVRQLSARPNTTVIAAARNPDEAKLLKAIQADKSSKIIYLPLDVSDEKTILTATKKLQEEHKITTLDLLVNNAGVFPLPDRLPDATKPLFLSTIDTNVAGPLLVTQSFWPLLQASAKNGGKPKVVFVSSSLGSIGGLWPFDGGVSYRVSKAALGMLAALFAQQGKAEGITVLVQCPGWVNTDMGSENGKTSPPLQPHESISALLKIWDKATEKETGTWYGQDGKVVAW